MQTSTKEEIPSTPVRKQRVLIHRNFALLWSGQTISAFGSHITGTGIPLLASLTLRATPVQMGLLTATGTLPVLLIGFVAGAWVDRLPRRPVLLATDILRSLLLFSIPVAALLRVLRIEQLYLVAALVGVLSVFFDVAHRSFLPCLVASEQLVEGNSKLSTSESIAEIGGPTLAGLLIQAISAPFAIFFDALSFLVSAVCIGQIKAPTIQTRADRKKQTLWQEVRQGLQVVLGHPALRAMILSSGVRNFFGGAFAALYSIYVLRDLHMPPLFYGVFITLGGVGALGGAITAPRIVRRFGMGITLIIAFILSKCLSLLTPLASGPDIVVIVMLGASQLIGDFWYMVGSINEISLLQKLVPDHLLGRSNASMQVLTNGMVPVGALLAGMVAESIGTRTTLLLASVGSLIISSALLLFSPLRHYKD